MDKELRDKLLKPLSMEHYTDEELKANIGALRKIQLTCGCIAHLQLEGLEYLEKLFSLIVAER